MSATPGAWEFGLLDGRPRNRLLMALSHSDYTLIEPYLNPTVLRFRQRLEQENRRIRAAYFLESGLASVVAISHQGRRQAEVAVIGNEGMTAVSVVLGADQSPNETFMQVAGDGKSIAVEDLRQLMDRSTTLCETLYRYAHYFCLVISQTALVNAHGSIEERLARWLIMAQDRLESSNLSITHEYLSLMLGVRRAGVTTALHQLESRSLLSTARGTIRILDRAGLQRQTHGLYGVAESELDRLFPTLC